MMDIRSLASRLHQVESVAWMPVVGSTNSLGRRVIDECIENEIILPLSVVIAGEQKAGRGRESRSWSSPAGGGIYATILLSRPSGMTSLLPLEIAVFVARFLRETYSVDARIKWPNDIFVAGRKLGGILIEARTHDGVTFVATGVGINVVTPADAPQATSLRDSSKLDSVDVMSARVAFVEYLDRHWVVEGDREAVIAEWRSLSHFQRGDQVDAVLHGNRVTGEWEGIDEQGRALIRSAGTTLNIAAGDIISSSGS